MPRIGPEKFYGGVLTHDGLAKNRMFQEVMQVGQELQTLQPLLAGTQVKADVAILLSHASDWALDQPMRPNKFFSQREHVQLYYTALHDRNILVDFARPSDDLSKYKVVIAPSLHMISGGDADVLRLYVHNGGTLVGTFNTGLVDENNLAATDPPYEMSDMFGLKVVEFDPLPPARRMISRSKVVSPPLDCTADGCGAISSSRGDAKFSAPTRRTSTLASPPSRSTISARAAPSTSAR